MGATGTSKTMVIQGGRENLVGRVEVPGDKSISHRATMLGALGEGTTRIRNFLPASDCLSTLEVVRGLGVEVVYSQDEVLVRGLGLKGWRQPTRSLECGGSGTTMRLMAGLLAGLPLYSILAGNTQLSRRPMDRVAVPLRQMGATILGDDDGKYPPLSILGGDLRAIRYEMPIASAQVKSAVLLAGLFAQGVTSVVEAAVTRDHTERMLTAMGVRVESEAGMVQVHPSPHLEPLDLRVPADMSSAAFLLAIAAVVPGSRVMVPGVGINPGRVGILHVLRKMGAEVCLHNQRVDAGEPVADIEVRYGTLRGISIGAEDVPTMIDELPVLAVIATQAEGVTEVRGAAELRVKETDRIATTVSELRRMGARIEALEDGFVVEGPTRLHGAHVESHDDHRLAMSLAVAALAASGETTIEGAACLSDSFPGFEEQVAQLIGY
ncbi:MAG TPA: 3-phosphoshikimate 1-carboxyvinyltransferase [Chloroflexia bacterium]|nr:3-phosphoshikimate 1-carboxyvinyltransferase [Chloroflexia bacterium]